MKRFFLFRFQSAFKSETFFRYDFTENAAVNEEVQFQASDFLLSGYIRTDHLSRQMMLRHTAEKDSFFSAEYFSVNPVISSRRDSKLSE